MSLSDLRDVIAAIDSYIAGDLALEHLQATIVAGADRITEYDRRDVREKLLHAEGELEVVRFTTDSDKVMAAALPVVVSLRGIVAADQADGP